MFNKKKLTFTWEDKGVTPDVTDCPAMDCDNNELDKRPAASPCSTCVSHPCKPRDWFMLWTTGGAVPWSCLENGMCVATCWWLECTLCVSICCLECTLCVTTCWWLECTLRAATCCGTWNAGLGRRATGATMWIPFCTRVSYKFTHTLQVTLYSKQKRDNC